MRGLLLSLVAVVLAGCAAGPVRVDGVPAPLPAATGTAAAPTATASRPPAVATPSGTAVLPAAYAPDSVERLGVTAAFPAPAGWSRDVEDAGLWYGDPSGRLLLRVEVRARTGTVDAARAWELNEPTQRGNLPGYRRLAITPVAGPGSSAADWTFTFERGGTRQVVVRGIAWRGVTVSVYFSAEQPAYERILPVFRRVVEGLRISGG